MKRILIAGVLSAIIATGASGQINSADAIGFLNRGVAMFNDHNYNGCIDQLSQMRQLDASLAQQEEAMYYIAMATLHVGDDEALDLLRNFLIRYPESTRLMDATAAIGDFHFTRSNYGDALKSYAKVNVNTLPADRSADVRYRQAYSNMFLGQDQQAETLFNTLLNDRTYKNAAIFYKGYIAYSENRHIDALAQFQQVDPSHELGDASLYYISQIHFSQSRWDNALNTARKAIASNREPNFRPELTRIIGESLYNLNRTDEALPHLREYVNTIGDDAQPSSFYMLGVSEYNAANYAAAIPMLQKAVHVPNSLGQNAYLYLGQCYVKQGNNNAAIMAFDNAYRINADAVITETARYNYIATRMDGGRMPFGNSVGMLEEFLSKYPNSPFASNVQESLVSGYMSDDDFSNALRIIDGMSNPSPKMLEARQRALFLSGMKAYQSGDTEKALEAFNSGINANGGNSSISNQCLLWAANCQYDLNNYDVAADSYTRYLQATASHNPNRTLAHYNLGYVYMSQERYPEAIDHFKKVTNSQSVSAQVKADSYNRIGDCLYVAKEFNAAQRSYQQAFDADANAGDYAMYQMAMMKGHNRDHAGCINSLDQMMAHFPSSALVPDALLKQAESRSALGQPDLAIDTYRNLIERYPTTAQGRQGQLQLALALINNDNRVEAIDTYQNLIRNNSSSDEAKVALNDLKTIYADDGNLQEFVMFVNSLPNAPQIEPSSLEAAAFDAAEEQYMANGATRLLKSYIEQFPNGVKMPSALYYLTESASENNDHTATELYATRLVKDYPDAPEVEEALLMKAASESALGKGEIALDTYLDLENRASSPKNLREARMGIMLTAIDLNRYNEVLTATDNMLSSTADGVPEKRLIQFYRALALERTNQQSEAASIWSELATDPSDIYGSKSAVYLAQSLLDNGDIDKARTVAEKFIEAGSPSNYWYARGFIVLSDILKAQNNQFEAKAYLNSLKSNYPGDEADIFQMIEERLSE